MAEDMEERARRVRNLLSSYYGTSPAEDADNGEVDGEVTSPAKVNINTRGFDAQNHVNHMVRPYTLRPPSVRSYLFQMSVLGYRPPQMRGRKFTATCLVILSFDATCPRRTQMVEMVSCKECTMICLDSRRCAYTIHHPLNNGRI